VRARGVRTAGHCSFRGAAVAATAERGAGGFPLRCGGRVVFGRRRERLDGAPGLCYRFAPFPVEEPFS
jgi:hypothetical protein